jgi:hypothetical protein
MLHQSEMISDPSGCVRIATLDAKSRQSDLPGWLFLQKAAKFREDG